MHAKLSHTVWWTTDGVFFLTSRKKSDSHAKSVAKRFVWQRTSSRPSAGGGCITQGGLTIRGAPYQRKVGALFSYAKPGFSYLWRCTFSQKSWPKNLAADRRGPPCGGSPLRRGLPPMVQPVQLIIRPWHPPFSLIPSCSATVRNTNRPEYSQTAGFIGAVRKTETGLSGQYIVRKKAVLRLCSIINNYSAAGYIQPLPVMYAIGLYMLQFITVDMQSAKITTDCF